MKSTAHQRYEVINKQQDVSESDPFTSDRYSQFSKYLPLNSKAILDVGCNTGRGGDQLKKLKSTIRLSGLDCVEDRLDRLPDSYEEKLNGLSTSIPADDGTYDAIVAGEFLEHLYPADVDGTLWEFQRVLKVGGRLLMTTPNPNYIKNKIKHLSVYSVSHLTQHYPRVLSLRLKMAGFSNVRVLGSGKVSRYLGYHFPLLSAYGSYLVMGDKR